jgi:hypothetical protein
MEEGRKLVGVEVYVKAKEGEKGRKEGEGTMGALELLQPPLV